MEVLCLMEISNRQELTFSSPMEIVFARSLSSLSPPYTIRFCSNFETPGFYNTLPLSLNLGPKTGSCIELEGKYMHGMRIDADSHGGSIQLSGFLAMNLLAA